MHVLVCGGRDFGDAGLVNRALEKLHAQRPITLIINGGANGADKLAFEWAKQNGIPILTIPADWRKHGKAAGPKRNKVMLEIGQPEVVCAFPGGKGTAHMIGIAEDAAIETYRIGKHTT